VYTVKQIAELAEISVRTLHYYDEIGLLHPSKVGANGYRYYDDAALLRLQQILFYREIGLELTQIKELLDSPNFDVVSALRTHRSLLQEKINRLQELVGTVDRTVMHLVGELDMAKKKLFTGFSEEKQRDYERRARLMYDPDTVNESVKRWNGYTAQEQESIKEIGGQVYLDLTKAMEAGKPADSHDVQEILARWHDHIRYFYEPTLEILRGLGELYATDPEFMAFFHKFHKNLPEYLRTGITQYVDDLETAEIEHLLAQDEAQKGSRGAE
jgi:MerR family transcriptional regulator, thiopeptide resistance regulator